MSSIFISYSRKDIDFARQVVDALAKHDLDTWIDWQSIPKGEDWKEEIDRGIEGAETFIFLMSPDSAKSEICNLEIAHALENNKRIIPIVIRETNSKDFYFENSGKEISSRNWIFCRDKADDFNKAIQDTIKTIHTDYEWVKYHTKLQVRALEWERSNQERSLLYRGKELESAEYQLATNTSKEPNPTKLQNSFILKSRQSTDRQRRITFSIVLMGVIVLAALAVFGFVQAGLATERGNTALTAQANAVAEADQRATAQAIAENNEKLAEERARIARAKELAARSISLQESNFQNSLLLGIESFNLHDDSQTRGAILDNLLANPQMQQIASGHSGGINCVAFNPDGRIFASGSSDDTIIIWDVATGKSIAPPLRGHKNTVTSIAFSPDGNTLASGGGDNKIILWDVKTWQPIAPPLTGHSSIITEVAYSPDGKFFASGSADGKIILWDAVTRRKIGQPLISDESGFVYSLAISQDSRTIAATTYNSDTLGDALFAPPYITFWNVETGKYVRQLLFQQGEDNDKDYGPAISVAFSPDGQTLAVGTTSDSTILWNMNRENKDGAPLTIISSPGGFHETFSPNGELLAMISSESTIILRDIETGQLIGEALKGHSGTVTDLAFNPDGSNLISGSEDGTIIIWEMGPEFNTNAITNHPIRESLTSVYSSNFSMAFSPDGKTLASGNIFAISFWDMTISPPSRQSTAGNVSLGSVHSVAFSPNGKFMASANESEVILWDVLTMESIMEPYKEHTETINSVAFSPDSKILVSGDNDGVLRLINVTTHKSIGKPITEHSGSINSVAFSPEGKILASAGDDKTIRLWDVSDPAIPKLIRISSTGESFTGHSSPVNSIAFNHNGKTLASGDSDGIIILWDVATGNPIVQLIKGHLREITGVAFSPDGNFFASASNDQTIILWDPITGNPIGQPLTVEELPLIYSLAFSPDGKILVAGGASDVVNVWDVDPQSWIQKTCQRAGRNFTQNEWKLYFPNEDYRKTCDQWPIDFGNYRQTLEETIVDINDPQQIEKALDNVRVVMEVDTTSVIEDPASAASEVVTEWIAVELSNMINGDYWQETLVLIDQLSISYENIPINVPFIKEKVTGEIESMILGMSKVGDWEEALDIVERISTSYETLPIDVSALRQSIGNKIINEISIKVESNDWKSTLHLLDLVTEKNIRIEDANLLNEICWYGSLNGYAPYVLGYCEQAVELAPNDANIRDSRGLARALTGDFDGAIDDFQYYVENSSGSNAEKREQWIIELKAGRNPFTKEVLNDL